MRRLFIMRKDLNMSPGKLAAQVAHCAEAYWTNQMKKCAIPMAIADDEETIGYNIRFPIFRDEFDEYVNGLFTKTICEARNKNHLLKAKTKAEELGLEENKDFGLIYDNCLTDLEPEEDEGTTLTGIWFRPLDDETAHLISKKYQLYK